MLILQLLFFLRGICFSAWQSYAIYISNHFWRTFDTVADTALLFSVGAGGMNCLVTHLVKPCLCMIPPRWRAGARGINFAGLECVFAAFFGAIDNL